MTIPPYARLAAKLLKRERELLPSPAPPADAVRADAIGAVEQALAQRARRKRARKIAWGALSAAAAFALLWFGAAILRAPVAQPPPLAARDARAIVVHTFGQGARVSGGDGHGALAPGARVQARPDGHALLAFATGTRVALEGGGDLSLVQNDAAQVLALDRGALRADVAKLAPGHRFLIHTQDAEVEVHGTSFRVISDGAGCAGSRTRVQVFEGVVTVRHGGVEARVGKGQEWPERCAPESAAVSVAPAGQGDRPAAVASAASAELAASSGTGASRVRAEQPARGLAPASQLLEQNDAFAAAVAAHHAGDEARAVRGFDALLARYPSGPLTESAEIQRIHALHAIDPARARELARVYLARYPNGFARDQAAAVAAGDP